MKLLILLTAILSCSAIEIFDLESLDLENAYFDLDEELVDAFLEKYEEASLGDESEIIAVVDEYADKIFENIHTFALANGLDPIQLGNISEEFLASSINLTEGLLHGISTIGRNGDVEVTYRSSDKIMDLYFPIVFSNINFTYDYHLIILLIGPAGSITGKIEHFEMDLKVSFDFQTYQAKVDSVKTTNTGHVDLTFHGNDILDLVINIISEFVTTILHPVIVGVIEGIVTDVVDLVVDTINSFLDSILHPTTEATTEIIENNFYLM